MGSTPRSAARRRMLRLAIPCSSASRIAAARIRSRVSGACPARGRPGLRAIVHPLDTNIHCRIFSDNLRSRIAWRRPVPDTESPDRSVIPPSLWPSVSRPAFAPGYGIPATPDGMLPWDRAVAQLEAARTYWLVTARAGGRPHVAPVWGVWLDGALYFGTDLSSVKGRNLAANPALTVHLESGDDVVILEVVVEAVPAPAAVPDLDAVYQSKYAMSVSGAGGPTAVWYAFRPSFAQPGSKPTSLKRRPASRFRRQASERTENREPRAEKML